MVDLLQSISILLLFLSMVFNTLTIHRLLKATTLMREMIIVLALMK